MRDIKVPKIASTKPFYQQAAKKQMEQYLKTAGGKSYLKSPFEKGFKAERSAYEHGHREGMTKEELYAFSKITHGGSISKEKGKLIAGAALEIAREHEQEAGGLAGGLSHGKMLEAEKKLMRMQHDQEPKPKPIEKKAEPSAGQKLSSLQQRLHIQHSPLVDRPNYPAAPATVTTEPTHLSASPVTPPARTVDTPRWQPPSEQATPATAPPSSPRLSQFSSGFTGGTGLPSHPVDEHNDAHVAIPTLHEPLGASDQPVSTEPASEESAAPAEPSSAQLPDTSHVDEGLPF